MDTGEKYYIVKATALPEIFPKVCEVTRLMESGKIKTVGEAVKAVGISRSAYYKYKDVVRPFNEMAGGKIITFHIMLEDMTGVLSGVLRVFAEAGANILTINQSIPINGRASLTISSETAGMTVVLEDFVKQIEKLKGICSIELISGE